MSIELEFWGAARTVTGSMHLVHVNGQRILLDCGMYHGRRDEAMERNSNFPFDPASIDAIVLSHAHIDHSGNLPGLVKQGFSGPIYCTPATESLCQVMLKDSAYIQEKDAEFINKRHKKSHLPLVNPLYTQDDVDETVSLFQGQPYSKEFEVVDGVRCRFEDAGHILGSASVSLDLRSNGQRTTLAFTGDLGRPHLPILRDPVLIANDETEFLICESTYGGRFHSPQADMEEELLQPILRAIERRGKIVIPAFSVGRTQEIVYLLHQMSIKGKLGHIPVYVDSPLSVNVTDVFKKHTECFDEETLAILHAPENNDPFGFERLKYVRTLEESKALNDTPGPFIVISASGMCEAGRVVHHLANSVGNANNIIMIVGYQAEHTLGKRLVMKEPVVNIFGEPHELKAEVVVLNAFSAHADRNEMLDYLRRFPRRPLRKVFLVHGDPDQSEKLGATLTAENFGAVVIPARGTRIALA
jgi:metallo-beta-lactamase family protein